MNLMTDDVLFIVPGRQPFGRVEFAAASRQMKGVSFEGTSDIQENQIAGDWAYFRSHLEIAMTPPGGGDAVWLYADDFGPSAGWTMGRGAGRQSGGMSSQQASCAIV
jgi:ketosteroid isomerase-like protein